MNFVGDLHEGVKLRDQNKLKSAYSKSLKASGTWQELNELCEQFENDDEDNNMFFLLYQDLRLRRATPQKSWSEKLALYHNFCCLLEEIINTNFLLPAEWLWEILAAMVNAYVSCTNEKWSLLKSSTNLTTLEEAEYQTFRELYDFDVVENLLLRLIELWKVDQTGIEDQENISAQKSSGQKGKKRKGSAQKSQEGEGSVEAQPAPIVDPLMEVSLNVAKIALIKLYGAVDQSYNEYVEGIIPDLLPPGAKSILNYAQVISAMEVGNFQPLMKDATKFGKTLNFFSDSLNDLRERDAKILLESSLRPMCAKCDFTEDCVQEDVRERLVERIWSQLLQRHEKENFLTYARIYRSVNLETLAKLSGCENIEIIRAALVSDPRVTIVNNVVQVTDDSKVESYAAILKKQALRAKELTAHLKKL